MLPLYLALVRQIWRAESSSYKRDVDLQDFTRETWTYWSMAPLERQVLEHLSYEERLREIWDCSAQSRLRGNPINVYK